jgi:hypothetical protein
MAKLKMKKTVEMKKKSVKPAARAGKRGGSAGGEPRKCGVCGRLGHNKRSHGPGGRLAKR